MRTCIMCGAPATEDAAVCAACGTHLPSPAAGPQGAPPPQWPGGVFTQGGPPVPPPYAPPPQGPGYAPPAYPPAYETHPYGVPPQAGYGAPPRTPQKKGKAPLVLGIVAGVAALAVLVAILLNAFGGRDEQADSRVAVSASRVVSAHSVSSAAPSSLPNASIPPQQGFTWLRQPQAGMDLVEPILNSYMVLGAGAFVNYKVGAQWGVMAFDGQVIFEPYDGQMTFCPYGGVHSVPPEIAALLPDMEAANERLRAAGFPFETHGDHGFGDVLAFGYDPATGSMELGFLGFGSFSTLESIGLLVEDITLPYVQVIDLSDESDGLLNATYRGLATIAGEMLLPVEYDGIVYAVGGVCTLQKDGLYGYYAPDERRFVAECVYEPLYTFDDTYAPHNAGWFSSGMCPVRQGGLVGVIDKSGAFVAAPQFENASQVYEGQLWVQTDGLWGLIELE